MKLDSKKLKILITGASGFVGSNIVKKLHKKYDFFALVREKSKVDSIKQYCKIYRYSGDLNALCEFVKTQDFDGVLHLAACCILRFGRSESRELIESNITLGVDILESLRENVATKTSNFKFFINTLTFSMFANSNDYRPANLYDATKQGFYDITLSYCQEFPNAIFSHLLLYDTYGANDSRNKIFNLWAKGAKCLEMSKGKQLIDLSYIDDVVNAFDILINLCVNKKVRNNQIFSIENSKRYSLKELASIFEKVSNKKLNIKWGAKNYRKNEIFSPIKASQNKKLLAKLPTFKHKINIESGFKMLLDSIKTNGGGGG
ncbi:NAD-dependent epimerase/dehydratase family protein [Helicobacter saguini]|uniref:NAD-dependent epimerase/dehydratase family protein n=1 Tax=Helicobacter saguini TaxID=1548018 RepID=A0A4U8T0U7_9HELI|nr:NAD-dependent epimerase/dehydratase family protein [Helicobacter saguini]MWV68090.1 NAD-dependent epimerase/dehydratase family protein [Helicobacter saguini]TLD92996.1 NAD-dependent epimerase/dehydratase family protein [Helicobacter saguini]